MKLETGGANEVLRVLREIIFADESLLLFETGSESSTSHTQCMRPDGLLGVFAANIPKTGWITT
jgi:hypothetical protein